MGRYDIYLGDAPRRDGKDPFRARAADGPLACFCNNVSIRDIRQTIDAGARTLGDLFDATSAGCGPCGGTCQPRLVQLLVEARSQTGEMKQSQGMAKEAAREE
ncbi:MAG: (2Fe-2S)-binding protein [Myxococcota bacterium]